MPFPNKLMQEKQFESRAQLLDHAVTCINKSIQRKSIEGLLFHGNINFKWITGIYRWRVVYF